MKGVMRPLTCATAMRLVSEERDDLRIDPADKERLADHLNDCPSCRQFVSSLEWTEKEIRQPLPSPRKDLITGAFRKAAERPMAGRNILSTSASWGYLAPVFGVTAFSLFYLSTHRPVATPLLQDGPRSTPVALHSVQPSPMPTVRPETVVANGAKRNLSQSGKRRQTGEKSTEVVAAIPRRTLRKAIRRTGSPVTIAQDDLDQINASPATALMRWAPLNDTAEQATFEQHLRQIASQGDDFVSVPFPQIAALNSRRAIAEAEAQYRREAAIIDPRLQRSASLAVAEESFAEFCAALTRQTGIEFTADPTVASDNLILYCRSRTLREIMRQISRHFGFTWRREGEPGQYRYVLAQEVTGQLMEEELRNRDRNEAILAMDLAMQQYRPSLGLTPDGAIDIARKDYKSYLDICLAMIELDKKKQAIPQALRKRQQAALSLITTASRNERLRLLSGSGWAPIHLYFRLTAEQHDALRRGETLIFSSLPAEGEIPLPPGMEPQIRSALRDCRVIIGPNNQYSGANIGEASFEDRVRDFILPGSQHAFASVVRIGATPPSPYHYTLTNAPAGETFVMASLKMVETEAGTITLQGSSGFGRIVNGKPQGAGSLGPTLATGKSSSRKEDLNALRQQVAHYPMLSQAVAKLPLAEPIAYYPNPLYLPEAGGGRPGPWPMRSAKEVLRALHEATGADILSDGFYGLTDADKGAVSKVTPLSDVLQQIGAAFHLRWRVETGEANKPWLLAREQTFFNERLKQVPKSLWLEWAAHRRENGHLPIMDLAAIARLTDAQLDSANNATTAVALFDIREWEMVSGKPYRGFWRFYNRLDADQKARIWSQDGLTMAELSSGQVDAFISLLHGSGASQISAWQREQYVKSGRLKGRYVPLPEAEAAIKRGERLEPDVRIGYYWGASGQASGFQLVAGKQAP